MKQHAIKSITPSGRAGSSWLVKLASDIDVCEYVHSAPREKVESDADRIVRRLNKEPNLKLGGM